MISIKDLMVGDYVQNEDGTIVGKVECIDSIKNRIVFGDHTLDAEFVFPVHLTEKILLKQSFLLQDKECRHVFNPKCNDDIIIDLFEEDPRCMSKEDFDREVGVRLVTFYPLPYPPALGIRSNFVHELQHALRLCGIEKEVVV